MVQYQWHLSRMNPSSSKVFLPSKGRGRASLLMNTSKMSSMTSLLFDDVILLSLAIDCNDIYEEKKVPTKATAPRFSPTAQSASFG